MRTASHESWRRVVSSALALHERVERNAAVDLARERSKLINLVLDVPADRGESGARGEALSRGPRYALVCWIDELFTCHSRWADQWNEQKLESSLYGGNDRAREFWRQARLAEAETTDDTLAVYFLCVALGFRGQMRSDPEGLQEWVEKTRGRLTRRQPPQPAPTTRTRRRRTPRPLVGAQRFRRMASVGAAVVICLLPLATYAVMQRLLT